MLALNTSCHTGHRLSSPDVGVPRLYEPVRHLLEPLVQASQPLGEVVEAPGTGEVEAVQVNKFTIGTVGNLHNEVEKTKRLFENIKRLLVLEIV